MGDPCKQDAPVARLEERSRQHDDDMRELKELLKANNVVLTKVAEVVTDVRHLHEDSARNEKAIGELFKRVRTLEIAPGQKASKVFWMVLTSVVGVASSITTAVTIMVIKQFFGGA